MRIGMGYDVHQLVEDRALIIGGVTIPHEKGLLLTPTRTFSFMRLWMGSWERWR